jgi:predicted ABC-type transport system involved in lysophospholipase L1 biosynthesis ATPase subunit
VTPEAEVAVHTRDLSRTYGHPPHEVRALCSVSLVINRGERVALLGKSGSGKSTLLNLLGGLDRPTSGSAWVFGHELHHQSSAGLARYRLSTVGMVFQAFHLLPDRTALENVALPLVFAGRPKRERMAAAQRALEAVGLGQRLTHRPTELSGGESQRVAIARALVNGPSLLLADEPTGNLDSTNAAIVMELLTNHVRSCGATLLLVTHDEELARRCTDRIVRLQDGRLVAPG